MLQRRKDTLFPIDSQKVRAWAVGDWAIFKEHAGLSSPLALGRDEHAYFAVALAIAHRLHLGSFPHLARS